MVKFKFLLVLILLASFVVSSFSQVSISNTGSLINTKVISNLASVGTQSNKSNNYTSKGSVVSASCGTDTLYNWYFDSTGTRVYYWLSGGVNGYLVGHNIFQDNAKVEFYCNSDTLEICGVLIDFAYAVDGGFGNKIWVELLDAQPSTGIPAGAQASELVSYSSIVADVLAGQMTEVIFSTPVTITSDFYVGFTMSYTGTGDTVACASTLFNELSVNTAWEQLSDFTWNKIAWRWGWQTSSLSIFPLYSGTISPPVYDTIFITVTDTTYITVYDTIIVFDVDTTFVTIYDTVQVFYVDTIYVTIDDTIQVYDTVFVTIYDSIAVTDTLIINVVLGWPPPNDVNAIKVYPNPATNMLTIDNGRFWLMNDYKIEIIDNIGVQVFFAVIDQQMFTVDISTWAAGLYYIHIKDSSNQVVNTRKIVLQ